MLNLGQRNSKKGYIFKSSFRSLLKMSAPYGIVLFLVMSSMLVAFVKMYEAKFFVNYARESYRRCFVSCRQKA